MWEALMAYITAGEFIKDLRETLEDQTGDIPTTSILADLRLALMRMAREDRLEDLFLYHDTLELGRLKEDGSPAASWTISGLRADDGTAEKIGEIITVKSLLILKTEDCKVRPAEPCYLPYKYFRKEHPFPECETPGDPCFFTIYQFQGTMKIIFDRPINRPYAIDMLYAAFHPRITKTTDTIRIPVDYEDLLIELVKTLYYEGTSDMSTSRAVEDKIDYLVSQIGEMLHKNPEALPLRTLGNSY